MEKSKVYIKVTEDGPYLVYGKPKISETTIMTDEKGISVSYAEGEVYDVGGTTVALCRCGKSHKAPFCDGNHAKHHFNGKETASFELLFKNAEEIGGPNITLFDNEDYCAFARFCDQGARVWNLAMMHDKESSDLAVKEAGNCPGGRLVVIDNEGNVVEPKFEPSISPIEDSGLKISGPLWVKGGILVQSASGRSYEVRNRQALCRCGYSSNKPFCNGAHASVKFKAIKES